MRVGGRGADQRDVDRGRPVEQPLLAFDLDQLDEVLGGRGVDLAAAEPRIDVGVQADLGKSPGWPAAQVR